MNLFLKSTIPAIRWVSIFSLISIFWIGTIFTVNFAVDPFGNRDWIVEKKFKPIVHERSEKYHYIFHQNNIEKYDCVILGSSRVMSIVPSSNDETKECYNFGVHVANNPEKLFILQEWLKRAPLKKVYLGNELYTVHSLKRPTHLNTQNFIHGSEGNYLSFSTFIITLKTLKNTLFKKAQTHFREDGSVVYTQEEEAIKAHTFDHSHAHFKTLSYQSIKGDYMQTPFEYDPKALEPLKQIKSLCDKHQIQLFSFLTPTYIEYQNAIQAHPELAKKSKKFRDDLHTIFGTVYDFDINISENSNPVNFYDPVHYRPVIGVQMLEEMQIPLNRKANLIEP